MPATRSGAGAGGCLCLACASRPRGAPGACLRARSPRPDPRGAPGPCLGLSRGTHLPASCNFFPFSPRVLRSIFVIPRRVGPGGGSLGSLTCGALLATLARIGPCMCGGSPRYDAADRVWKIMEWPSGNDRDGLLPFCSTWEALVCSSSALGRKQRVHYLAHVVKARPVVS